MPKLQIINLIPQETSQEASTDSTHFTVPLHVFDKLDGLAQYNPGSADYTDTGHKAHVHRNVHNSLDLNPKMCNQFKPIFFRSHQEIGNSLFFTIESIISLPRHSPEHIVNITTAVHLREMTSGMPSENKVYMYYILGHI